MLSKWDIIILVFAFLLFFFPRLIIGLNNYKSLETLIDPVYLTGFITASGILWGFIGAVTLAKYESLEYGVLFLVTVDFGFFIFAVMQIFFGALEGKPTLSLLS